MYISYSWMDSKMCKYHLFVWINLNFLHCSQRIIFPIKLCLVFYSLCANLLHSLIMWSIISSISLHNQHQLFCYVLSILAFTYSLWRYFLLISEEIQFFSYVCISRVKFRFFIAWNGGPAVRVFANGSGDLGSIPGRVIPKTLKMELDTTLLNTQHYKVRFKGKVEQSWEWSSAPPLHLGVVAIEKGAFGSPSTMVANLTLFCSIFFGSVDACVVCIVSGCYNQSSSTFF